MDPWEALDVDDSDIPSLLRPCKQRRHDTNLNNTSQSQPNPSQSLQTLDSSYASQTLEDSHPEHFESTPPQPTQTPSFFLIPGPAGAVQTAMLRKSRDIQNNSSPIPTQEYIRKAVEDAAEDDDFKRHTWLSAIDFVSSDGMLDCVLPRAPLGSIRKWLKNGKLDQVVAVIKSCTPNGLGDLMVTLKDPTGTVSGTIHHKVLAEGEFAKDISVGSVLILRKVSVFSPSRSAHYLNITLRNVVQVFRKDGEPSRKQNYHACAFKYVAPGSDCVGETRMAEKAFPPEQGGSRGIQGIMNEIRTKGNAKESLHIDNQQEQGNVFPSSVGSCSNRSSISINQNMAVGKEPSLLRQGAAKEICNEAVRMEITEDEGPNELGRELVENCKEKEIRGTNADLKQREPLMTSASLLQWTDEQLNELFAQDCEDDGSLF